MLNAAFTEWLSQNGLTEAFTTMAGDALYVNTAKQFGVLKKSGDYRVLSFYLDDIVEVNTYDDEHLLVMWSTVSPIQALPRSTRFSTNEVYMNIRLKNQQVLKLQIFHGVGGNIRREDVAHVNMCNYAYQLTQAVCGYATSRPGPVAENEETV